MVHQALFKKELQQNRIKLLLSLLLLGAGAVALPLLFGRTWPVFSWTLDFSREAYDLYIWNRWTAGVMLYVSLFSALLFGAGAISGERAAGTEIVLLSKPLSRREIYTSKVAAGLLLLLLGVLGSTLLLYLASWYRGYLLDPKSLFTAAAITWMGAVLVYLAVLIFSVLFSSPVKAGAAAALFILALSLPAYFEATESYSLLYYMKAVPYWQEGQTPLVPLGFFLVAGGLLYETGVILYDR